MGSGGNRAHASRKDAIRDLKNGASPSLAERIGGTEKTKTEGPTNHPRRTRNAYIAAISSAIS